MDGKKEKITKMYPLELKEPCKSCLGCMRLENPYFVSDPNCKWRPKKGGR